MLTKNPKQARNEGEPSKWFGYYAGYSGAFVAEALQFLHLAPDASVIDPWNGSGTTTDLADQLGYRGIGFDLNPAVVLVAKARLLRSDVRPSHRSLGRELLRAGHRFADIDFLSEEPLATWFCEKSAAAIRGIERAIQHLLLPSLYARLGASASLTGVSPLASYYYVALFRTVRRFLFPFQTSNPTWIRSPDSLRTRLRTSETALREAFEYEVEQMFAAMAEDVPIHSHPKTLVNVGNSTALPLKDNEADAVVSSPPYCTRIDYAVAMKPELAILGVTEAEFRRLRLAMLGCTILDSEQLCQAIPAQWGKTCGWLLEGIRRHSAHGSRTYYHQTHYQYFSALYKSLSELARVLRPGACAVLVVQDSYYKEQHTDLQTVTQEMCTNLGLHLELRRDYSSRNTKAAVNTNRLKYRNTADATESVLVFRRAKTPTKKGHHVD